MSENLNKKSQKKNIFYGLIPEMKEFYKKELKSKHMWNFVIAVFIFFIVLITISFDLLNLNDIAAEFVDTYGAVDVYSLEESMNDESIKEVTRFDAVKQQLALIAVTVISGLTPFLHIPVLITIIYPIVGALSISTYNILGMILMTIVYLIELFIMSLVVAVGMYWCKMATKHFRYNQSTSFTFNDVRLQFNEALKKDEKVEEIKKKMEANYEKIKALNEKTNYKAIVVFSVLCAILMCVCTFITGV